MHTEAPFSLLPTIYPVACHTDNVGAGTTFVVIKGMQADGSAYIPLALEKGAKTLVVEQTAFSPEVAASIALYKPTVITVPDCRHALSHLSAQAAGFPAERMTMIGITGTKGKTTSAYSIYHLLTAAGHKTALLSTVKNKIGTVEFAAPLTTAQPDYLHQFLKACVDNKITHVVMEVAAQALSLHRVADIRFDGIIFTNLDQEHGEFYATQQDYLDAKKQLFGLLKPTGKAVINADDATGKLLTKCFPNALSVGFFDTDAQSTGTLIQTDRAPYQIRIGEQLYTYQSLAGNFNASNLLCAITLLQQIGLSTDQIQTGLHTLPSVPGRLEQYTLANGARAIIDYAHTPGSYTSVLATIRPWTNHLTVIFGAGGNRDPFKRPLLGKIAARYADTVIVTTDNPRTEDPQTIISQILAGIQAEDMNKVIIELDRQQAIQKAYAHSDANSIIVCLGKGPDEYQIIGATKHPFSEKQIFLSL